MGCYISELRTKEVICKQNGLKLGNIDDIEINISTGQIDSIVIYGRTRVIGLPRKKDDIIIPWESVDVIGEDTVLVNYIVKAST